MEQSQAMERTGDSRTARAVYSVRRPLASLQSQYIARSLSAAASAPSDMPVASGGETDLVGLGAILRQNWWKIALCTLLSLGLAIGYLATAKQIYTATSSIFIDPRSTKILPEAPSPTGFGTDLALVESQAAIMTSDTVLRRVVDNLRLAEDMEYAPELGQGVLSKIKALLVPRPAAPDKSAQAVSTLAESIKVKRAAKSYVVDVDVSASDARKAARVAQAVVDAYIADQTAAKAAEAKRANTLLDTRLGELRAQVQRAEKRVDDFKKANKILTSEGGIVTEQQLTKLNGELITARAVAAESKARLDQLRSALKSGAGPESLPDAVRSGLVSRLREQFTQVARREAALSSQLQARHPVLIEVRSQLAEVKTQINAELKRVAIASQSEAQIARSRERELEIQLDKAKSEVTRSNTAQIKVRELDQDVIASRELLKLFLSRAKETQEEQNISTPDARIITPPAVPTRASKPVTLLVLGLGLLGGLGSGLAWALLSDHLRGGLRTAPQFAGATGFDNVSAIPRVATNGYFGRRGVQPPDNADGPPAGQFADLLTALADTKGDRDRPYRQAVLRLLTRLKSRAKPGRPHTVLMASSKLDNGNSATALAVAYAAALSGDKVLLVDATSHRPDLSTVFASHIRQQQVVMLDNKDHLKSVTAHDARSGLSILPIALADLRTLKSQQRRRLVAGLNSISQDYELIIIDAGGLLEDEAALCLLPAADQIVIVARAGVTDETEIAQVRELLANAEDRITGAVLTMADRDSAES
jgi:polysaccharide biosynthesis transport protein